MWEMNRLSWSICAMGRGALRGEGIPLHFLTVGKEKSIILLGRAPKSTWSASFCLCIPVKLNDISHMANEQVAGECESRHTKWDQGHGTQRYKAPFPGSGEVLNKLTSHCTVFIWQCPVSPVFRKSIESGTEAKGLPYAFWKTHLSLV